jgi:hypothetical protein
MPWPDIFFVPKSARRILPRLPCPPRRRRPRRFRSRRPPPRPRPGRRSPVMSPRPSVEPLTAAAIKAASVRAEGTRTLPVMHGVVLRPLTRSGGKLTFPTPPAEPIKNIEQLMTEADPVKTLSQTGSVRMLKRLSPEAPALRPPGTPPPIRAEDIATEPAPAAEVVIVRRRPSRPIRPGRVSPPRTRRAFTSNRRNLSRTSRSARLSRLRLHPLRRRPRRRCRPSPVPSPRLFR